MNQEPQLFLLRGVSGAGKTTLAHTLLCAYPVGYAIMLAADDWMLDAQGNYCFDKDKLPMSHKRCEFETRKALVAGKTVIVHNTFSRDWELRPYIAMASALQVRYHVLLCESGWRDNVSNTHAVPQEIVTAVRQRFQVRP